MHGGQGSSELAVYVLSRVALPLARRLAAQLAVSPWQLLPTSSNSITSKATIASAQIYAPARFCPKDALPFTSLPALLAQTYSFFAGHAFIGAAGIAVRCLASLLIHKSVDAPVLVLDTAGQYVISLLSGHWGGGNALARHVASLLQATPVITTASDGIDDGRVLALDLLLRQAGLRPIDWECLPHVQGMLLEGEHLPLWDPCHVVPEHPGIYRVGDEEDMFFPTEQAEMICPVLAAHWKRLRAHPQVLRIAVPWLFLGVGCRRHVNSDLLYDAVCNMLKHHDLEPLAVAGVATVNEKVQEPAIRTLAERMNVPILGFAAETLVSCITPHPSAAAGQRFGLQDFSVCEAAAMMAAELHGKKIRLLVPKSVVSRQITMAVAIADRGSV